MLKRNLTWTPSGRVRQADMGFDERKQYLVPLFVLTQVTGLGAEACVIYTTAFIAQTFTTGVLNLATLGYLNGTAMVLYRVFPGSKKLVLKVTHAVMQFVCVAVTIGTAAFSINTGFTTRPEHEVIATTHSWTAITCSVLFIIQWTVSMFVFVLPSCQPRRADYLIIHRYFGGLILAMAITTIMMGTVELNSFSEFYDVQYMVTNLAAMLILMFGIIVGIILLTPSYKRPTDIKPELQRLN